MIPIYTLNALDATSIECDPSLNARFDANSIMVGFRNILITVHAPGAYLIQLGAAVDNPRIKLVFTATERSVSPPALVVAPVVEQPVFTIEQVRYANGAILVDVRSEPLTENQIIEVGGDLQKRLVWDARKNRQQLRFPYVLRGGLQELRFQVADAAYTGTLFDPSQFPARVVRVDATTFKLDRVCGLPIDITGGSVPLQLVAHATRFTALESATYRFAVQGYPLFEQYLEVAGQLPLLELAANPLRVVLDNISKQDVGVWLQGLDRKLTIPAGQRSLELPAAWARGVRQIKVLQVENARYTQADWVFQL